jgi:alpha,alpha-trehalase
VPKYQNALNWIESFWPTLIVDHPKMEESLISVPHSYIVPGGMFDEFYYWDTYFAMLGLAHEKNKALLEGIVENFLYLFEKYNVIPNGNRTFYLNRSQPPFLALMIDLVYKINHDKLWLLRAYEVAKKEYEQVWLGNHKTSNGLSRYCHSHHLEMKNGAPSWQGKNENEKNTPLDLHHLAVCESGWDYTPRFEENCPAHNPVDLNCLLFEYEKLFIKFCVDFTE